MKHLLFIFAFVCICSHTQLLAVTVYEPSPDPVADSLLKQQRDSMIFQLNLQYLNGVNEYHNPFELISILEEILNLDPGHYNHWLNLGMENIKIREYDRAIEALNRGLELYPVSNNPSLVQIYISLSFCYHKIGRDQLELEVLDSAYLMFPDHPGILGRYIISAHTRLRNARAEEYEAQLVRILRGQGINESNIAYYLGRLYLNADYVVAEKHFRTACQYDPDNLEKQGALAWVLIRNSLKIDEGLKLMEQAIDADPSNAVYVHQQGYGFYVKGQYEDALFNLYNARELYQQYSYDLDIHILMVEEAIASLEE